MTATERERLSFIHALSGCDTISSIIYTLSKIGILSKLSLDDPDLNTAFDTLLPLEALQSEVVVAGLLIFQLIYGVEKKGLEEL